MKYRDHYFKRESGVGDSDTTIIDIHVKDPISQLSVEYEMTNGATSCTDHELHDDIASIELVDGSEVLWSLDMQQARALNFFENKVLPHEIITEGAAGVQAEKMFINFGRFRDDPEFYLDPSKYNNLQLRLTHTLTISATVGFATGTGKVTVMARIIEEGAKAYKGFLSARERIAYTSGTSGDKEVELPTNRPYRLLMLQALLTTKNHEEVLSQHKLSIDTDSYVPINMYSEDITDLNRMQFGLAWQKKEMLRADDGASLLDLYNIQYASVYAMTDDELATVEAIDAESVQVSLLEYSTPATPTLQTTAHGVMCLAQGLQPYGCLCLPFGDMQNPEDWLRAEDYHDIRLFSTQAAAGACSVVVQQWML